MPEYLGQNVDDDWLTHLVDSYIDGYDLAGGTNRPSVGEALDALRDHGVVQSFTASQLGRTRAELEQDQGDGFR